MMYATLSFIMAPVYGESPIYTKRMDEMLIDNFLARLKREIVLDAQPRRVWLCIQ